LKGGAGVSKIGFSVCGVVGIFENRFTGELLVCVMVTGTCADSFRFEESVLFCAGTGSGALVSLSEVIVTVVVLVGA
jgi:hypothetical protein